MVINNEISVTAQSNSLTNRSYHGEVEQTDRILQKKNYKPRTDIFYLIF
jgi:hypothetical protein